MNPDERKSDGNSSSIALTPFYSHEKPNEDFCLYRGDVSLHFPSRKQKANVEIKFKWVPTPRVTVEGTTSGDINLAKEDEVVLDIPELDSNPKFRLTHKNKKIPSLDDEKTSFSGRIVDNIWTGKNKEKFREIIFHLPNFHRYHGKAIKYKKKDNREKSYSSHTERMQFEGNKWSVTLDQKTIINEMRRKLKDTGGFALGHTGKITRADKDTFDVEESERVFDLLYYFLSFCRGNWVGPVLPVGISDETKTHMEYWHSPLLSPYSVCISWFPERSIEDISNLFLEFENRWYDDFWRDNLRKVIYWYIEANSRTSKIDGPLILTQTALIHLSWVWIVEEKELYNTNEFKTEKGAAEKIETLLDELGIPCRLPENKVELQNVVKKMRETLSDNNAPNNGPELITNVRNMIVHPRKAKRTRLSKLTAKERFEVKQLALRYIEWVVLSLLEYDGKIYDRIEKDTLDNMHALF